MFPAVFLDRDGCVNVEDDHITDIERFRLYPDSLDAMKRLSSVGFLIVIITNQSGIARGLMTEDLVYKTHALLLRLAVEAAIRIDRIEYCPHHPDGVVPEFAIECDCRKPAPGMILRAAKALPIDLESSYVVGDKISDIKLGPATGVKSVLVRTGFGAREEETIKRGEADPPDHIADGIAGAVDWIIADSRGK